ncbi:MAG TPA: hypothetical protein VFZ72_14220 [Jiangellaceae bacterium]
MTSVVLVWTAPGVCGGTAAADLGHQLARPVDEGPDLDLLGHHDLAGPRATGAGGSWRWRA